MSGVFQKKAVIGLMILSVATMGLHLPSANVTFGPGVTPQCNLVGYNGNDTIYMTTGIGNAYTDSPHFSNLSSNGYANSSCLHSYRPHYVLNSVGIATGSNYSYKGEEAHPFSESCNGLGLSVYIPVAVSGLSFVPNEVPPLHPQCPRGNNSVWGVKIYSSFTGISSCGDKTHLTICRPYDSGLNISGENGQQIEINGDAVLMTMGGIALSSSAVLFPPAAGVVLASAGAGVSFASGFSQMVNYVNTNTSLGGLEYPEVSTNTLLWNQMFVDNGIWKKDPASAYGCGNFSNAFSAQELLNMKIPYSAFSSSGCLHLEAQNIVSCTPNYYEGTGSGRPGATANLSIPIVPAYTIHGEVKGPNGGLANQKVLIKMRFNKPEATNCVAYVVNTNSAGDYKFFAKPGYEYNVSLCSDRGYSYSCFPSANNFTSSANRVFKVNPVEFHETQLPPGQLWSVDLNGDTVSTTSSSITFGVTNGTYSYTIKMPSSSGLKYTPSNPSGSVTVSGSDVPPVSVRFIMAPIAFHESGLNGNTWSVTLDGATSSTSGSVISFPEPINNTYSYTIGVPPGYSVSPSSGSVSLGTTSVSVSISFTPTAFYTVTFGESGLPSGASWKVYLGGMSQSSTGTSITFNSVAGGTYSFSIPQVSIYHKSNGDTYNYGASPSYGTINVNGAGKTISTGFSLVSVTTPPGGGGGGGGGGTRCVNSTTEILMANGTYMQAQYILPHDTVIGYNITTHSYGIEEVKDMYISHHSRQYTINGILQVSAYEPVLTSNGYVKAANLTTHDRIYNVFTGRYMKVHSITISSGNFTMYDFRMPPDYNFIAWMYVVYDITIRP